MTGPARRVVVGLASLWLAALVLGPFLIALKISVAEVVLAQPPFTPLIENGKIRLHWGNYQLLLGDALYIESYLNSLRLAGIATAIALAIGLPFAYALTNVPSGWRPLALTLAVLPFWTSSLIRIYAWIGILGPEGPLNTVLKALNLVDAPVQILNTDLGIVSGLVYCYLPFMVLPLYASLVRIDPALGEAASDLGAKPATSFVKITLPLALPGILAGCLLVFIPATGEFVIPDLMGGSDAIMIGKTLWTEFFSNRDWPLAGAATVVLVMLLVIPVVLVERRGLDRHA